MKRLTIFRHAKASRDDLTMADFDRPLTKRGEKDAALMGQRLLKRQALPDHFLSSPARRALDTASIVAKEIGFPVPLIAADQEIYNAALSELIAVVQRIYNGFDHVILFGHNPGFQDLSAYLTNQQFDKLPTSGIVCIDFEIDAWAELAQGSGKLAFFDYPKNPEE